MASPYGQIIREAPRIVQEDGVCWIGGSRSHHLDATHISVSDRSTTDDRRPTTDVDRSADSIVRAARQQA